MPNERISMVKLKQLIALQASNLSVRALSRAVGLSVGAVSKYLRAVRSSGIEAAEAQMLSEAELERRVFGAAPAGKPGARQPSERLRNRAMISGPKSCGLGLPGRLFQRRRT